MWLRHPWLHSSARTSPSRIILVAADFSKEITTTVLWLNDRDLDIRCIRLRPYKTQDRLFLDVQQILPLPEATEYTVKIKEKAVEKRATERKFNFDFSKYDLTIGDDTHGHLTKRALGLHVIRTALRAGIPPDELAGYFRGSINSWLIALDGDLSREEFSQGAAQARPNSDLNRFHCKDEELVHVNGKTYAISNQWDVTNVPAFEQIVQAYPRLGMQIAKAES
jgi:hypothetical protein